MKYVFVDPSGSFTEGKGHTGVAIIIDSDWSTLSAKSLAAKDYNERHLYWQAILNEILKASTSSKTGCIVIIESFQIRANGFLIGKMPETILCIGALIWELEEYGIDYVFQSPTQAKSRFKDEKLPNYIPNLERRDNGRYFLNGKMINDHIRDALKHLLYFQRYGKVK